MMNNVDGGAHATTRTRPGRTAFVLCAAALGALVAIFVFGIPASRVLVWGLILFCPLSHFLFGHGAHGHGAHGQGRPADGTKEPSNG